jgi:hypothetical protein
MFADMKISTKLIWFTALVVVVSVSVTTFAALFYMRNDLTQQAGTALGCRLNVFRDLLRSKGGADNDFFRIDDDRLMIGSYAANGDHEVVDRIKKMFGGTATISWETRGYRPTS